MVRDPIRDAIRGVNVVEQAFFEVSGFKWAQHAGVVGGPYYLDTVAPFFVFLSGMSPVPPRRHVGVIGIGLALNAVTAVNNGAPHVRIPGVLQRLGLAGLLLNEPRLACLQRYYGLPLVFVWYAISLLGASDSIVNNPLAHPDFPDADLEGTAQTRLDRLLFGVRLYKPNFDPEGLLSTVTTMVTMLTGKYFQQQGGSATQKALTAVTLITTGEALSALLPKYAPMSKSFWTPSFVLVTSGYSILKYLALEHLIPQLPLFVRDLLIAAGQRPLESYIISYLFRELYKTGLHHLVLKDSSFGAARRAIGNVSSDLILAFTRTAVVIVSATTMRARNWKLVW